MCNSIYLPDMTDFRAFLYMCVPIILSERVFLPYRVAGGINTDACSFSRALSPLGFDSRQHT